MHSAILPGYTSIGIHENHMRMTKFKDARDAGYISILNELLRWTNAFRKEVASTPQSSYSPTAGETEQRGVGRMPERVVFQGGSTFSGTNITTGGMVSQGNEVTPSKGVRDQISGNNFHQGGSTFSGRIITSGGQVRLGNTFIG